MNELPVGLQLSKLSILKNLLLDSFQPVTRCLQSTKRQLLVRVTQQQSSGHQASSNQQVISPSTTSLPSEENTPRKQNSPEQPETQCLPGQVASSTLSSTFLWLTYTYSQRPVSGVIYSCVRGEGGRKWEIMKEGSEKKEGQGPSDPTDCLACVRPHDIFPSAHSFYPRSFHLPLAG